MIAAFLSNIPDAPSNVLRDEEGAVSRLAPVFDAKPDGIAERLIQPIAMSVAIAYPVNRLPFTGR